MTKLEAKLAFCEIESETLIGEISSSQTSGKRQSEAQELLDAVRSECADLLTELDTLRRAYPTIRQ